MVDSTFIVNPNLFCIGWGNLRPSDGHAHMDCPVVILTKDDAWESAIAVELLASGRTFPMVCPCDCRVCKEAWWKAGRPIVRDGSIIRSFEGS
jgi:hypothetical protein